MLSVEQAIRDATGWVCCPNPTEAARVLAEDVLRLQKMERNLKDYIWQLGPSEVRTCLTNILNGH